MVEPCRLRSLLEVFPLVVRVMCVSLFTLLVAGSTAADPPTGGLVGYWAFDGNLEDASSFGNHAEDHGAAFAPDRFGRPGLALQVTPGYVTVPDDPSLAFTDGFSVALWLRQDGVDSAFNCFMGKDYTVAFAVGIDSGNSGDCPDPQVQRPIVAYVGDQSGWFPESDFSCGTGEWVHVAVTFDAALHEMTLYVDGELAQTRAHDGTLGVSTAPLGIGRDGQYNDTFFGLLDEVCLYSRALTAPEVEALYTGEVVTPTVEFPGAYAQAVAASAHAEGINQTLWLTDLVLHNPGSSAATCDLFFLATATDNTSAAPYRVTVPADASVRLADVVSELFGRDGETGAILVGADLPLIVSSRTFNNASTGTFGQHIGGEATSLAWEGDSDLPRLVQLAHSPDPEQGFRTNLGAVNLSTSELTLDVELHRGGGELLGTIQLVVPPFGHLQYSNVFATYATDELKDAFAEVVSASAGARYLVYASVVDNRSGDPVFIPGR